MDETRLRQMLDAFNRHDLDLVMSFFTDDCALDMPRGPAPSGRHAEGLEAVRALLATRFSGIPDVHYGDDRHFVAGDRGVEEPAHAEVAAPGQHLLVSQPARRSHTLSLAGS